MTTDHRSGRAPAVRLESPLPASLPAGCATVLYCSGSACEPADLELLVDGTPHRPSDYAMPRFDLPCRRSGFWGTVPVRLADGAQAVRLGARVRWREGTVAEVDLGEIAVAEPLPRTGAERSARPGGHGRDLIAICMGTFEPDRKLFERQIGSLRAQSDQDWICVISDDCSSRRSYASILEVVGEDQRFHVSRAPSRIGFYRNFERALKLAPGDAALLALCDQDDRWHPEKLAVLRGSLGASALVYSDLRLVDADGRVLRDTLWRGRANNSTNLGSMLIANTVTGASALFRREVAELALPFPDSPGIEFHDHWIALIALASGELAYVGRPLYDYVQHPGAILGKVVGHGTEIPRGRRSWVARIPRRPRIPRRARMREWRAAYFLGYVPGEIRARTLLLRTGERLTPPKRRQLERYLAAGHSPWGLIAFVLRPARMLAGRTETLGGEWELALGIVWRHLARLVAQIPRWPERFLLDTSFPDPPHFEQKRLRSWRERI